MEYNMLASNTKKIKSAKEVHNDHYTINYKYNRDKIVRIDYHGGEQS
jgi:hypothetical protein